MALGEGLSDSSLVCLTGKQCWNCDPTLEKLWAIIWQEVVLLNLPSIKFLILRMLVIDAFTNAFLQEVKYWDIKACRDFWNQLNFVLLVTSLT